MTETPIRPWGARARTKRAYRLPDDPKGFDAMTETGVSRQAPGLKFRFPPDKVNKCRRAGASAVVKYEDSRVEAARLNSLHASRIDWQAGLLEGEGYFGTIPSHVGGQRRLRAPGDEETSLQTGVRGDRQR
jgi:hypothetical protein